AEEGVTVSRALGLLGAGTVDPASGATLRSTGRAGGGDLRIRDVIVARDALSGDDIANAVEITLPGVPGDGQADSVILEVDVDGIPDAEVTGAVVNFLVGGEEFPAYPLDQYSEKVGERTWRVKMELGLGEDLVAGQTLPTEVWVE